jgi:hypothetical protein
LPSGHKVSQAYPPTPGHYSVPKKHKKESEASKVGKFAEKEGAGFSFGYGVRLTCVGAAAYFTDGVSLVGGSGALACTGVGAAAGFAFKHFLWR